MSQYYGKVKTAEENKKEAEALIAKYYTGVRAGSVTSVHANGAVTRVPASAVAPAPAHVPIRTPEATVNLPQLEQQVRDLFARDVAQQREIADLQRIVQAQGALLTQQGALLTQQGAAIAELQKAISMFTDRFQGVEEDHNELQEQVDELSEKVSTVEHNGVKTFQRVKALEAHKPSNDGAEKAKPDTPCPKCKVGLMYQNQKGCRPCRDAQKNKAKTQKASKVVHSDSSE